LKKNSLFIAITLIFLSGCVKESPTVTAPKKLACIVHPTSKNNKVSIVKKQPVSDVDSELKVIDGGGGNEVVEGYCIVDVFTDSMFLDGDRIKLIKNLDALAWEKSTLLKVYKMHTELWNSKQRTEFQSILKNDNYLALCGDRRYYDNLLFTVEEPQADILHSILLLKYINNLSNGCMQWVSQKVSNENSIKNIPGTYLLDMIEKDAIVERLFIPFVPRQKSFSVAIRDYKKMKEKTGSSQELKVRRIEIEQMKQTDEYPDYKNK